MKFVQTFGSVVCLLLPSVASAATWKWVTTSTAEAIYYIDVDTIRDSTVGYPAQKMKIFWLKVDHSKDKTVNYREQKLLYHVKCDTSELKAIQYIRYNADGSLDANGSLPSYTNFRSAAPDTVGFAIYEAACFGKNAVGTEL